MSLLRRRRGRWLVPSVVAVAVASGLVVGAGAPAPADQNVVVSPVAESKHPRILDGRVYAIANNGPDVLVGGTFTTIRNGNPVSPNITQAKLFKFNSGQLPKDNTRPPNIVTVAPPALAQSVVTTDFFGL